MTALTSRYSKLILPVAVAALMAFPACGADPTPTPVPTPTPAPSTATTADPTPTTAPSSDATTAPATTAAESAPSSDAPTTAPAADTPTPPPAEPPAPAERSTGDVDGIVFVVLGDSEATFSVGEVLAGVSVPDYEAVMRTTELSGEVRLDGAGSLVTVGLHSMTSDEPFRDRYVQNRMFPGQPSASVAFGDLTPLPDGFTSGDEVTTEVTGTLNINDMDVPLTFEITARDDGHTVFVLGRSMFTWDQIGEPVPTARSVVSVEDEVRVEVLLALRPQ
ncbi:MAG: YceI family protein [Chloroflexota bacterium]|nr:YceI family protein [Chloroflexota bacterium]MDE2885741.1 YceI family protein [Chloroflexota bacterium]